ncbi:amidase family protein [uncultured Paracoccus sp.]|uniref:amidase family protein n=1 Tax=uncultured Paracoccus sp. TaxID=189685 RepID=UPI00263464D4|nr:amidase family protein [uncultured Paracoccus sp.]
MPAVRSAIGARREKLARDLARGLHHAADDRRVFLIERGDEALAELEGWAALEHSGAALPALAGTVLTVKACLDVGGWVTSSASASTQGDAPASDDAPVVAALRASGAVLLGQTNMTEFAYGALGVNSRFGTPRTPLDPTGSRVAGGSTSGGAVAAATRLADLSLGSDTSGSVRIPAAFCGCFGFKPSMGRYPGAGMQLLSRSFDVPGLLAADLATIRDADRVLVGDTLPATPSPRPLRYAIPADLATMETEAPVRAMFDACVAALQDHDVRIETVNLPTLAEAAMISGSGGIIAAEAYAIHAERLAARFDAYDPLVGGRIRQGAEVPAHRYATASSALQDCRRRFDAELAGFDGFLAPTTPMVAPEYALLADMERYLAVNSRVFSLTESANRLDLTSISLPLARLPTGIMLTGTRGGDAELLAQAGLLASIFADLSPLQI